MRLIDIEPLQKEHWRLHRYVSGDYFARVEEMELEKVPTIDAVRLDKLCEWLEVNARTPIYNLQHTAEWWKESLTMWMEEENHAEK